MYAHLIGGSEVANLMGYSMPSCAVHNLLILSAMPLKSPLHFTRWVTENAHLLQPPVNNFCIYDGGDFTVMAVGGPNERNDYHVNETEVREHCARPGSI